MRIQVRVASAKVGKGAECWLSDTEGVYAAEMTAGCNRNVTARVALRSRDAGKRGHAAYENAIQQFPKLVARS